MTGLAAATLDAIAADLAAARGTGRQMPPLTATHPGFAAAEARAVRARLHAGRLARGDRAVGRKIGFTNTTIWPRYNVDRPLWGHVYALTLHDPAPAAFAIAGLPEPRLEPEIVLQIARPPEPGMDDAALAACIGWIAHGFEIVQSVFPGWRFTGDDATAAFGLHGALLVGPHRPVQRLDDFTLTLARDGVPVATGHASAVLGGPLRALAHLAAVLADDPDAPPLRPGEIVTTGTLTDAMPLRPGAVWTTALSGVDLPGLRLAIV